MDQCLSKLGGENSPPYAGSVFTMDWTLFLITQDNSSMDSLLLLFNKNNGKHQESKLNINSTDKKSSDFCFEGLGL